MSDTKSQSFNGSDKHVQVIARPRPLSDNERGQNLTSCLNINETRREILVNCKTSTTRFFNYDHVFGFQTRQQDVYKTVVSPIVDEVLKGYSSTIFAYGQTGSGKTHTMLGKFPMDKFSKDTVTAYMSILESEAGIMPRAIHHIFQALQRLYVDYTVKITYLELYNEELTDLLADSTNEQPEKIKIYEDKDKTNTIVGAIEATCETPFDAFKILIKGSQRRQTAETLMNASSSRSHSIFTMTVTMKDAQGDMRLGKLHLVDLAGSENISRSGATDKRAREAGTINQSLLTLGRVITALISNEKHICYRDSKLTRILQDSLCGKTITSIIITLSPANEAETLSTLEYGHRARSLKIRPEINQLSSKDVAREYIDEIRRLRQELDAKRETDGIPYSQYLALKNQMTLVQTLADNNQIKLEQNEQQFEQYRTEIESLRRQLLAQQQEFRSEINDRQQILALNRHRYDELVQTTNKALIFREQALNAIQQLRTVRSNSSTLIDQYLHDCRSIEENLQIYLENFTENIQTIFSTCHRSISQILSISTNLGQEIGILNEKSRAVLSLVFQNFHTIFEDLTDLSKQFQNDFEYELKILIEQIRNYFEIKQDNFVQIKDETMTNIRNSFQQMFISLTPSTHNLWKNLYSFLTQRFNQMIHNEFRNFIQPTENVQLEELDLNIIQSKWINEHEKSISIVQIELEQIITHLIQTITNLSKSENVFDFQRIHELSHQHNERIRHFFETKFQLIFNQIRDQYDQQCTPLIVNIEQDIIQINRILHEINLKFDPTNESFAFLTKQSQRLDVISKNFEYDWNLIAQTVDIFESQTISSPPSLPKSDVLLKTEMNKENFFDGNLLSCRSKNDTPFF